MDEVKQEASGSNELDLKVLLKVLLAVKKGEFSARMPVDLIGIEGKIADTLNEIIEINDKVSRGITRASELVGREGKLIERVSVGYVEGA